ncbi:RNA polymerase sigma factor [Gabonibacter chumensis]|uniref:RNA polymerase sigma factor n=1 Tax=Gabonibacter chumensis TaxID=2972474 RepID=UPI002572EA3E|nr:sigma-70 family RNA polymerase sigma factor [Gabonibacter chumensis]MCR9012525.1 sigma-70 family RNA polymerase sigma factor [Gabonibacter chumensis]
MIDNLQFLHGVNHKEDAAWEELYRYYYAPLCSYAAKLTGDSVAAEDIVQNGFIKLWNSSFDFSDIKAITTYMYRFTYNGALNYIRDKKSSDAIHRIWVDRQIVDEEKGKEMALEEETISRFHEVLSLLSGQQKEILFGALEGATVREIAGRLSISENTVKTQKRRAYQAIREHLGKVFTSVFLLLFARLRNVANNYLA